MTYKPAPLVNFPADTTRELEKVAVEFGVHVSALASLAQRVQALELRPVPPVVVPPVPDADVLWRWDATSAAPFGIHAKSPGRVTFVQAGGRNAARLLTMPGDNHVNGSEDAERCDLRLGTAESDAQEGREWWFKHCVWFPDDYVDQPQSVQGGMWHWGVVLNWHEDSDNGVLQQPLQLMMHGKTAPFPDWPTGLSMQIYGGTSGNKRLGDFPVAPIERNKWYDFVYHIKWTSGAAGFADGWVNGRQFMAHKGPTLHAGIGAYLKLANYHSAHGKPSAVLHGASVRGKTLASVGGI